MASWHEDVSRMVLVKEITSLSVTLGLLSLGAVSVAMFTSAADNMCDLIATPTD